MEPLHHEQLPVHCIVELIDQRRRPGNVGIRKQDVPSRLFPLYPSSHPTSILCSPETLNVLYEPSQPLPKRAVVCGFPRVLDEKDPAELTTKGLAHGFGHTLDLGGQFPHSIELSGKV